MLRAEVCGLDELFDDGGGDLDSGPAGGGGWPERARRGLEALHELFVRFDREVRGAVPAPRLRWGGCAGCIRRVQTRSSPLLLFWLCWRCEGPHVGLRSHCFYLCKLLLLCHYYIMIMGIISSLLIKVIMDTLFPIFTGYIIVDLVHYYLLCTCPTWR